MFEREIDGKEQLQQPRGQQPSGRMRSWYQRFKRKIGGEEQLQQPPGQHRSWYQQFQSRNSGWRTGVFLGLCTSIVVLFGNFLLVLIGLRYGGYTNGIGTVAQGQSTVIARIDTVYHVLINVLSTLLLTSSNYCMQVLCSPSRDDVDRAHSEGSYLHIGILSVRNIYLLGGKRRIAWFLLMLSSIPLHLL